MVTCLIISDLHLESYSNPLRVLEYLFNINETADLLILAGDIISAFSDSALDCFSFLKSRFPQVIFVPGNHEFFKRWRGSASIEETDYTFRCLCHEAGVIYLNKDMVEIEGVIFAGCTLWSEMDEETFDRLRMNRRGIPTLEEYNARHYDHREWIENVVLRMRKPVLMITHHHPTYQTMHYSYNESLTNRGYFSHLDHLIQSPIIGWNCGHTHIPSLVFFDQVPVLTNPFGYPNENGYEELPILRIKIEDGVLSFL